MFRNVDFPEPDRPTTATHSPESTTMLTFTRASTGGSAP
jgi:hypothetical protein